MHSMKRCLISLQVESHGDIEILLYICHNHFIGFVNLSGDEVLVANLLLKNQVLAPYSQLHGGQSFSVQ